jgi:hypothetical protein
VSTDYDISLHPVTRHTRDELVVRANATAWAEADAASNWPDERRRAMRRLWTDCYWDTYDDREEQDAQFRAALVSGDL